jgi:hypothetical protein
MMHYEALLQLSHDRCERLQREAEAERLALQARGQRQQRRRRAAGTARHAPGEASLTPWQNGLDRRVPESSTNSSPAPDTRPPLIVGSDRPARREGRASP